MQFQALTYRDHVSRELALNKRKIIKIDAETHTFLHSQNTKACRRSKIFMELPHILSLRHVDLAKAIAAPIEHILVPICQHECVLQCDRIPIFNQGLDFGPNSFFPILGVIFRKTTTNGSKTDFMKIENCYMMSFENPPSKTYKCQNLFCGCSDGILLGYTMLNLNVKSYLIAMARVHTQQFHNKYDILKPVDFGNTKINEFLDPFAFLFFFGG